MRRLKAQTKRQKCKYKRCTYKRTVPIEKPLYCAKHGDNSAVEVPEGVKKHFEHHLAFHAPRAHAPVFTEPVASMSPRNYEDHNPPGKSLLQHIKSFIFVDK